MGNFWTFIRVHAHRVSSFISQMATQNAHFFDFLQSLVYRSPGNGDASITGHISSGMIIDSNKS
jgi:hypothetical protein